MMVDSHPVGVLWKRLDDLEPYPAGVVRVPERIPGTCFFPGGAGLWMPTPGQPLPPFPVGGVMVLGQDFYSEAGYREILARGKAGDPHPSRAPTWRNLRALLRKASIAESDCFFTNAYMGLRAGRGNTGRFPGAACPAFVEGCRRFFREQVRLQRPRVVLVLGVPAFQFVAGTAEGPMPWRGKDDLGQVDAAGAAVVHGATFSTGSEPSPASVVALCHPCCRTANVGRRRFGGLAGDAAEVAMIQEAVRRSAPGGQLRSA